ncbi:hypothetical protein WJX74_005487 [Apatococcus lobatus]|uniref:Uncharacterized protein n=1 Tax=Apatococcus lobatus TaxID=904363 RepID=A0AAW1RGD1_9CHLO
MPAPSHAGVDGCQACNIEGLDLPLLAQPDVVMSAAAKGKLLGQGNYVVTYGAVQAVVIDRTEAALKQVTVPQTNQELVDSQLALARMEAEADMLALLSSAPS